MPSSIRVRGVSGLLWEAIETQENAEATRTAATLL
jgi:hypothetical protein